MKLKTNENFFILGIFLAVTGLLAALILAFFAQITKKPIADAALKSTNKSLEAVLPKFDNSPSKDIVVVDGVKFYRAKLNNKLIAVAGEATVKGYGGDLKTLTGLNLDGSVRSVIVLKHNETPGLGSNVCTRSESKTIFNLFSKKESTALPPNRILDFFAGKKANQTGWQIIKDGGEFQFITGSTITCRAVTKAVYTTSKTFIDNKNKIEKHAFEVVK